MKIPVRAMSTILHQGARPAQEDFAVGDPARGVFAVVDGFGGPEPGAAASKAAADGVREFLVKEAGDLEATLPFVLRSYYSLAGNVLFNSLVHANRKLLALNHGKGVHEKGGASAVVGFTDGDLLALASVGACEAWLLRDSQATQLVTPRVYGKLVDPFSSEKISGLRFPLMALGMVEDLEPEVLEYRIQADDWLLLSTGAMAEFVEKELIQRKLSGETPRQVETGFPGWLQEYLEPESNGGNLASLLVVF